MKKEKGIAMLRRMAQTRYFTVLEGVVVGITAGLVTVLFRAALSQEDSWLKAALTYCNACLLYTSE